MDFIFTVCIFVILFFMYVHIIDHYKKSEDMEIYEMDYTNTAQLQDVCKVKQPTLFEFKTKFPRFYEAVTLEKIREKFDNVSVQVYDTNDYRILPPLDAVDAVPLSFAAFSTLAKTDSRSHYFIQGNQSFIAETGLLSSIEDVDEWWKPDYTVHRTYDLLMGSSGTSMPMQYHTHYRRFIAVSSGKIRVKMTPWRNTKYLHPVRDYENYMFRASADIWNPQPPMTSDIEHTTFLDFEVQEGYVLYVPPYWWYSIKIQTANTLVVTATYDSAMSVIANVPDLAKYMFQQQNIKEKIVRTFVPEERELPFPEVKEINETVVKEKESESEKETTDSVSELIQQLQPNANANIPVGNPPHGNSPHANPPHANSQQGPGGQRPAGPSGNTRQRPPGLVGQRQPGPGVPSGNTIQRPQGPVGQRPPGPGGNTRQRPQGQGPQGQGPQGQGQGPQRQGPQGQGQGQRQGPQGQGQGPQGPIRKRPVAQPPQNPPALIPVIQQPQPIAQTPIQVPIREQHEQVMSHILG